MKKEKRFSTIWRNKFITTDAKTIDDFIDTYEAFAEMFIEWKELGVKLDPEGGTEDDYAMFYTCDEEVAKELEFEDDEMLYGDEDDDDLECCGDCEHCEYGKEDDSKLN
jgi:hypothetical protein